MIRDNFIESARTGWGNCKYVVAPNDLSAGVPDPSFNLFENYLMGYVPTDKSGWTPMRVDISGSVDDGQSLKLTRHMGKIGWTYTTNCLNNRATLGTIKRNNTNFWTTANYNPNWNILQDFVPAKYTCYGSFYLAGIAYKPTPVEGKDGWETIQNVDYYGEKGFVVDVNAVDDFFAGNYTTSITVNDNTYSLNLDNWNPEYNRFEIKENDTIVLCFSIRGIVLTVSGHYYDGSPISSSTEPGLLCVGLTQKVGDNVIYSPQITNLWTDQQMTSGNTCISLGASGKSVAPLNGYYSGDPNGTSNYGNLSGDFYYDGHTYWGTNIRETDLEIPTEFFQWLWSYNNSPSSPPCVYKGIPMTYIGGNRIYAIRSSLPLNLAKTAWYLINKVNLSNSAINGYSYTTPVSIFNSDDSPSYKRRTGTDEALDPILRPWQKLNAHNYDDEFKEDDIPDPEGGGDDWDPDTATGEDTNDYEKDPTTQLHQPFLGAIGQRWWAMENLGWSTIVRNVKKILTTWDEYVTFALPINLQNIEAEAHKNQYSSGFVANPVDCIAALVWYPFDITLVLDGEPADFVWGGTDQVIMTGVDADGKPQTTTTEQTLITGYLNNAYWLDGGFTDYFKHYENFIDYNPYCSAELYVPYCGSVKIDPQQYVGHHISVRYLVDFPTGACLALIYRDNLVVDTIPGQIGVSVAMSMPDYLDYGGRHMQAATSVKANKLQTMGSIFGTLGNGMSGNISGLFQGAVGISEGMERQNLVEYQLANTLLNQKTITTATPAISTGNEQVCRLVLYQPRWLDGYDTNDYGNYGHTTGFATIENDTLTKFKGLTIAESIDTSGISQATEKEKAMIAKAFKTGVYMPD